jgi:hypothetical protein
MIPSVKYFETTGKLAPDRVNGVVDIQGFRSVGELRFTNSEGVGIVFETFHRSTIVQRLFSIRLNKYVSLILFLGRFKAGS